MKMILDFKDVKQTYEAHIETTEDQTYYKLLETIIKNPERYTGIFRATSINEKLLQNLSQSKEIRFGDFIEELITCYIAKMGYKNLDKNINYNNSEKEKFNIDQLFIDENMKIVYIIEQKMRDDHDSTKKVGQFENFVKKINIIHSKFPDYKLHAIMWFVDDSLRKNKKYYSEQIKKVQIDNINIDLFYGKDLFNKIFNRIDIWEEFIKYLSQLRNENSYKLTTIPNFDTDPKIKQLILKIKTNSPSLYKKLMSNSDKYIQLRKELFPTGTNLK